MWPVLTKTSPGAHTAVVAFRGIVLLSSVACYIPLLYLEPKPFMIAQLTKPLQSKPDHW